MTAAVARYGKYIATAQIAAGGTGTIWRVLPPGGGTPLALKLLLPSLRNDRTVRKLFMNEYRIGRSLSHPGLLAFHDRGEYDGLPYVVMDLFRGVTLASVAADGAWARRLPRWGEGMIRRMAQTLAHVHQKNVVHRDIKPENILVSEPDGDVAPVVKLVDFASAQRGMACWWPFGRTAVGSPSYVAPEQLERRPANPAADIYAFGATLFSLFAGRPPLTGTTQADMLQQKMKGVVPSLLSCNAALTPAFAKLVEQCLARDPAARPDSMRTFLAQFARAGLYAER